MAISAMFHLKILLYRSVGEDPTMSSDIVGSPLTDQYCGGEGGGGGGGVVPLTTLYNKTIN